jgi:hypothetical protein
MDTIYIDKWRYEIQEQTEVPVCYTGICRPIYYISRITINGIPAY